jgi:hypothetical protein
MSRTSSRDSRACLSAWRASPRQLTTSFHVRLEAVSLSNNPPSLAEGPAALANDSGNKIGQKLILNSGGASKAFAITPSDSTDLPHNCRVFVGGAGNVVVDAFGGTGTVTFSGMPAGSMLPIVCKRVRATLTTATLLVGVY